MVIPFPKRIPLGRLLIFLMAVLLVQVFQGTDPAFGLLMLAAQMAAAVGFNHLGGMTHMAGAFCLFAVLPNITVPELTHIFLGQPGDYNLQHPILTSGACAVFFVCMMIAALIVSLIGHQTALVDRITFSILELRIISAISCAVAVSVSIKLITLTEDLQDGSLLAALNQFRPVLFACSVMLATYARIVTTKGKSVLDWYVLTVLVLSTVPGLLTGGKQGMLTPLFCWVVVVAASGHRFSRLGTLVLAMVLFIVWVFVYPYSQNARYVLGDRRSVGDKIDALVQFIRDPSQFPDNISNLPENSEFGTASSKVNIVRRYSLLQTNDMLIDADLRSGYTSIDRYAPILLSVVPHALWPDRPEAIRSNELGHKAGFMMSADDTTTGISIGTPALYFDLGGWLALIVYTMLTYFVFFLVAIRLVGSSLNNIWSLVPIGSVYGLAGTCSPASLFLLVVSYMGVFFLAIAILKVISYVAETLVSRPMPA